MESKSLDSEIRMLARENGKPFKRILSRFHEIEYAWRESFPGHDDDWYRSIALQKIKENYNVKRCE